MSESEGLLSNTNGNNHANNYGGAPSSPKDNTNSSSGIDANYYDYPSSPTYLSLSTSPTIDTCTLRQRRSSIAAMAAAKGILNERRESELHRKLSSKVSPLQNHDGDFPKLPIEVGSNNDNVPNPLIEIPSIDSLEADEAALQEHIDSYQSAKYNGHVSFSTPENDHTTPKKGANNSILNILHNMASQVPAIAIASVLNFMIGIPFGASYFPAGLSLPGKEVLGLRMFLFSTMVAQLVFTYKSKFTNGIGLQMVEVCVLCSV